MANFFDRIKEALPVWSSWAKGKGANRTFVRKCMIAGAAAGAHTGVQQVTALGTFPIQPADKLVSVIVIAGATATAPADTTSEYTITASGTISNTGGTTSVTLYLEVTWEAWSESFS